jgi:hypothetical protein
MHEHYIEENGELIDAIPLCSDACNRDYAGEAYAGWNGCHESEFTTYCANCGVVIPGEDACEHQLDNVLVNRVLSLGGVECPHGNWIQIPATLLNA